MNVGTVGDFWVLTLASCVGLGYFQKPPSYSVILGQANLSIGLRSLVLISHQHAVGILVSNKNWPVASRCLPGAVPELFCFCSIMVWTQGPMHTRQVFCHFLGPFCIFFKSPLFFGTECMGWSRTHPFTLGGAWTCNALASDSWVAGITDLHQQAWLSCILFNMSMNKLFLFFPIGHLRRSGKAKSFGHIKNLDAFLSDDCHHKHAFLWSPLPPSVTHAILAEFKHTLKNTVFDFNYPFPHPRSKAR